MAVYFSRGDHSTKPLHEAFYLLSTSHILFGGSTYLSKVTGSFNYILPGPFFLQIWQKSVTFHFELSWKRIRYSLQSTPMHKIWKDLFLVFFYWHYFTMCNEKTFWIMCVFSLTSIFSLCWSMQVSTVLALKVTKLVLACLIFLNILVYTCFIGEILQFLLLLSSTMFEASHKRLSFYSFFL